MTLPHGWRRRTASAALAAMLAGGSLAGALLTAPSAFADSWRDKEYWLNEYGISAAWQVSKGAGVKVAIIDSGVDGQHPDLKGVVVGGTDASGAGDPNGQKSIGAKPEHGTLVATLLAGRGHASPSPSGASVAGVVSLARFQCRPRRNRRRRPRGPDLGCFRLARFAESRGQDGPGTDPRSCPMGSGQRRQGHQYFPRQHLP